MKKVNERIMSTPKASRDLQPAVMCEQLELIIYKSNLSFCLRPHMMQSSERDECCSKF